MQPIKLRDLLDFAAVSSPTCAPSGDGYTWVEHQPDLANNTYTHELYLSVGGSTLQLSDAMPGEPYWLDGETFLYTSKSGIDFHRRQDWGEFFSFMASQMYLLERNFMSIAEYLRE